MCPDQDTFYTTLAPSVRGVKIKNSHLAVYLRDYHSLTEIPACRRISQRSDTPNSRSPFTSSRHETALGILVGQSPQLNLKTGNRILTAKFEKQPRLENLAKFLAAGFERRPARPHALKTRNFSEVGAVFQKFVPSGSKLFQNILRQHRTEEYHKNPVLGDPFVLETLETGWVAIPRLGPFPRCSASAASHGV